MTRLNSHERIIDTCGDARWRDPIDGGEEIEGHFAGDVEVEVDPAVFVKDKVADGVGALDFCWYIAGNQRSE